MARISPTQRTLKHLRDMGLIAQITERWNVFARRRQDLFGFVDVLALDTRNATILGIQTTSGVNVAHRIKKILASKNLRPFVLAGGAVEVWGWRKTKGGIRGGVARWRLRRVRIVLKHRRKCHEVKNH